MKRFIYCIFIFLTAFQLFAQNPCAEPHQRALVMGGGGSKGAFQAGAAYHLVMQRGCDFTEISGTSVGALNGAILAQAATDQNQATSLLRLQDQVNTLVQMWESFKSSKEIVKGRPLATLRFGLFGLEGLKNFEPLHKLLYQKVSLERLEDGRDLRVGTVSFNDGRYHELVLNPDGKVDPKSIDYLFGSSILPMFGTMPRIEFEKVANNQKVQFGDGALRRTVPVNSYFQICAPTADGKNQCWSLDGSVTPSHPRIEQLFVITTSPYERGKQVRPVFDPHSFSANTQQIRDGRKVMARALDLLMDTMYRSDLDTMYFSNDLLRWQFEQISSVNSSSPQFFPVRSFNMDQAAAIGSPTRPYLLGVIVPQKEDAEITAMMDFSPKRIAEQLYCGCMAADNLMQEQFAAESMANSCTERFRPKTSGNDKGKKKEVAARFTPENCISAEKINRAVADLSTNPADKSPQTVSGQHK